MYGKWVTICGDDFECRLWVNGTPNLTAAEWERRAWAKLAAIAACAGSPATTGGTPDAE
jgi:hypothetical protein